MTNHVTTGSATIHQAIQTFVRGFGFTRSFTHPYLAEWVAPLWVMRDAPRKKGPYRNEEWVAYDVAPQEVDRIAREQTRGRFALCVICALDQPHAPQIAAYKALGYRLGHTEPLMTHSLARIPRFDSPARVERVLTAPLAQQLAKAARSRQILPEHLSTDAPLRQYVAWVDEELVGWVRSIVVDETTWCSNMYVRPEYRRRGIARAMLCHMLRDDRAGGAQTAVLLASHSGAKLYPVVGYKQIGTLLLFTPKHH